MTMARKGPSPTQLIAEVADLSAGQERYGGEGWVTADLVQRHLAGLSGDPSLALVARRLSALAESGRLRRRYGPGHMLYKPAPEGRTA